MTTLNVADHMHALGAQAKAASAQMAKASAALSKESEEALLYRDMENDLVLQVQRRLAAIRQI